MPVVQKQAPPKPAPVKRATGSVLSEGIAVDQISDDYIKMVIYGRNRTGKTTLACQFTKPLLLISFEPAKTGGAKSVKRVPGVTYLRVTESRKAFALAEELKTDTTFKTHVLDTATSFQNLIMQEITGEPVPEQINWGIYSRDNYRDRASKIKEALRPFLNLNAHTVVLAQEKDHNPQDKDTPKIVRSLSTESFFASDLGAAAVAWLHDACDYIAQLYIDKEILVHQETITLPGPAKKTKLVVREEETGKSVRRLRTMLNPNYAAGFRSENPDAVPEFIEAKTPEEMFAKVMKVIQGIKLEGGK